MGKFLLKRIGLLMSTVMLVSIAMFGTTAHASFVWTNPTEVDVYADGTDIQNGYDLEFVLWNVGTTMTTVRVHTGNYSDLGDQNLNPYSNSFRNRFALHGPTKLEAAGDGPVLIYGSGQGSGTPVLLAAYQSSADGSIIDGKGQMTIQSIDGGRTVHVDQAEGITLKNLTVEGGDIQIFVTNYWQDGNIPNNGTLDNVTINSQSNQRGVEVRYYNNDVVHDIVGWTIKNCTISGGEYSIKAKNLKDSTITGNTLIDTTASGVALSGSSTGNVISGNDVTTDWIGIWADGTGQVPQITDNTIEAGYGALVFSTTGATGNVSGNTLLGKPGAAVAWSTWDNVINNVNFSYNTIKGFDRVEVGVGASNPPSVVHNTFVGNIKLYGDLNVYDNLFTGTVLYPPVHWGLGVVTLNNNWFASSVAEVNFASTDPGSDAYLYLSCNTPLDILTGATDGSYYGARPIYPNADCGPGSLLYDTIVDACCNSARTHGQFVKCVKEEVDEIGAAISDGIHGEIVSNAAHEICGKTGNPNGKGNKK